MKKIAIMQPYFFPHAGYFSLIKHTDEFIAFDTPQFIRHGWIERNRILKQNEGWLYVKVPLHKHAQTAPIKDVEIDNSKQWREIMIAQLMPYRKKAPYFNETIAVVKDVLDGDYSDIVSLNVAALQRVCEYLGIGRPLSTFSSMDLSIDTPNAPDEWALNICRALGDVDEYWNPPGGKEFFDRAKYKKAGIKLKFLEMPIIEYDQNRETFEPGLSIIDVMMFNSVEKINEMLDSYKLSE